LDTALGVHDFTLFECRQYGTWSAVTARHPSGWCWS